MKNHVLAVAAVAVVGMTSAPAMAEPLALTGNYLQVGISDYGTFGSNGNDHPGFIHDPSGTGTFDLSMDYVAPGEPHDGFSMISDQFEFAVSDNNYRDGFGSHSPTLLTGAAANGYSNAATWSGGNSFVDITNSYFFNDGDQRILVTTQITARQDLSNLAFARSVDPDPDSLSYGDPDTKNQRGNAIYGADDFIGSAGAVSGYALALINASGDTFEHTTSIQNDCCLNINPYDVLAHTPFDFYAGFGDIGLSSTGDHGLNLAYRIGDLAAGDSVTLQYYYAVGDKIEYTGGVTPVPEPGSWALLAAGLGLLGGIAGRRQRRAARSV